ncbi:uncharacterized protein METZ01_LOCUS171246, partial [marine metagenome]
VLLIIVLIIYIIVNEYQYQLWVLNPN